MSHALLGTEDNPVKKEDMVSALKFICTFVAKQVFPWILMIKKICSYRNILCEDVCNKNVKGIGNIEQEDLM